MNESKTKILPFKKESSKVILDNVPIEILQNDAKISNDEIINHPTLKIIQESGSLFQIDDKIQEIIINAKGLVSDSYRKENGMVLFGDNSMSSENNHINDVILNLNGKKHKDHTIFMVYYRRDIEEYFIKMIEKSDNFFCFASLCSPLKLHTGYVISVFNFNFKFTINEEDDSLVVDYEVENGKLITKILKNDSSKKYYGGRRVENEFYINSSSVSRIHFTIYYEDHQWLVVDGDCDKRSTSGTWHYVQEPFLITNNLKVKIGESTLVFQLSK